MVEKLESQINFSEVIQESTANLDDLQQDVYRLVKKLRKKNQIRKHIRKDAEERKGESGSEFVEKMHKNIEAFGRHKIVKTEKYHDSERDRDIIKNTYEDGSWSTEWKKDIIYHEYIEYYPNGNIKYRSYFDRLPGGQVSRDNTIYDEQGNILYVIGYGDPGDYKYEHAKYDEKGRVIYYEHEDKHTCIYDDEKGIVTSIQEPFDRKYKLVTVFQMNEAGKMNTDVILGCSFVGETGKEIDEMNNEGFEKLIEEIHLQNAPYSPID